MSNFKKIIFILLIICLAFICFKPAFAALKLQNATTGIQTTATAAGVSTASVTEIAVAVTKAFLTLIGTIFVILIIFGGFTWMTSSASPDKVAKARKLLINAIIGLAIVVLAYAITSFVATALESSSQNTPPATTNP